MPPITQDGILATAPLSLVKPLSLKKSKNMYCGFNEFGTRIILVYIRNTSDMMGFVDLKPGVIYLSELNSLSQTHLNTGNVKREINVRA